MSLEVTDWPVIERRIISAWYREDTPQEVIDHEVKMALAAGQRMTFAPQTEYDNDGCMIVRSGFAVRTTETNAQNGSARFCVCIELRGVLA